MFAEAIEEAQASHRKISVRPLLSLLILPSLALMMFVGQAHAQIVDDLEVDIPFQFHAGNAKLPAGKYRLHMLDDSNLAVMEISSTDGSTSALFEVQSANADSAPAQSELIFNKYGSRYFLAQLFEEGNPSGSQVIESRYEKRISQENTSAEHQPVSARHVSQSGM